MLVMLGSTAEGWVAGLGAVAQEIDEVDRAVFRRAGYRRDDALARSRLTGELPWCSLERWSAGPSTIGQCAGPGQL